MHGVYAWLRRHPRLVDGTLAVLLAALLAGEKWWGRWIALLYGPIAIAMIIPVIFRRRYPVGAFIVVIVAGLIEVVVNPRGSAADFAILIVLYTLAASQPRQVGLKGLAVCLIGAAAATLRWHPAGKHLHPSAFAWEALFAGGSLLLAWLLGDSARWRRSYLRELEEKTQRLERERHALAEVAAAEERARIAREMHDVVAHHVSVMVVQADGAAYALDSAPDKARTAIDAISRTGRQALTEMRRLLGVLRSGQAASLSPLPGIADIDELIVQAGVAVSFAISGTRVLLPEGAELAAYRAVQESLTNVRKHGGPGVSATVTLAYARDGLEILVTDDGRGTAALPAYPGGADSAQPGPGVAGHGLAGMRERAALYGGTVTAGPLPGGGFEVRVKLPSGAAAQAAA